MGANDARCQATPSHIQPRYPQASFRSSALAVERGRQAIELARRHGWGGEPLVAIAYPMLAGSLIWQGGLDEAERWLMEGEYAL